MRFMKRICNIILTILSFAVLGISLSCTKPTEPNDSILPKIEITSEVPDTTIETSYTLSGKITDNNGIDSVIVNQNGTKHGVALNGSTFSYSLTLTKGMNVIGVFAMDNSGSHNIASDTLYIYKAVYSIDGNLWLTGISYPTMQPFWYGGDIYTPKRAITLNFLRASYFNVDTIIVDKQDTKTGTNTNKRYPVLATGNYHTKISLSDTIAYGRTYKYSITVVSHYDNVTPGIYLPNVFSFPSPITVGPIQTSTINRTTPVLDTNQSLRFNISNTTGDTIFYGCFVALSDTINQLLGSIVDSAIQNQAQKAYSGFALLRVSKTFTSDTVAFDFKYGMSPMQPELNNLFSKANWPFQYNKKYRFFLCAIRNNGEVYIDTISIKGPTYIWSDSLLPEANITIYKNLSPYFIQMPSSLRAINIIIQAGTMLDAFTIDSSFAYTINGAFSATQINIFVDSMKIFNTAILDGRLVAKNYISVDNSNLTSIDICAKVASLNNDTLLQGANVSSDSVTINGIYVSSIVVSNDKALRYTNPWVRVNSSGSNLGSYENQIPLKPIPQRYINLCGNIVFKNTNYCVDGSNNHNGVFT